MNQCCLFAVVVLLWSRVETIPVQTNVDTEEPSVIKSPNIADPNDGFGWTTVFHQIQIVNQDDTMAEALTKTRVLIGAPRGTYPGGLNLTDYLTPTAQRTGLVYSCPIGPGTCEGVTGDTTLYNLNADSNFTEGIQREVSQQIELYSRPLAEGRLFDQAPDSFGTFFDDPNVLIRAERKTGQLMGSFIYSSGDNVVACAPRWVYTDLSEEPVNPTGICFLGQRDLTGFITQNPCRGGSLSNSEGDGVSYCSLGSSATITNDRLIMGGLGYNYFIGRIFSRALDALVSTDGVTVDPPGTPTLENSNQLLFGNQVISGSVTGPDENIVVTAPRSNGTHYVGAVYVYGNQDTPVYANIMLEGRQIAEFFGYSIALCDLTGDGFDELLVGAPMYTNLDPLRVEQGRLYVFFNNGGNFDTEPVIIPGSASNGRFGFNVQNAGDLDADGHEDMIVSAPYETSPSTENTGAVYVYYGRDTKEEFQNQSPQKIHADEIVSNVINLSPLKTFGFSLSGNMDVDQNRHTDIAVGSLDQTVVVLRTRPFINVSVTLDEVDPVNIDENPSFNVTVRATYTSILLTDPLSISFTLREVISDAGAARLFFTNRVPTDIVGEGMFSFTAAGVAVATVLVYTVRDVSEVTPYQLSFDINDVPRDEAPVSGVQPVTDLSTFPRIRVEGNSTLSVTIIDPCGTDGCASDVVLMAPTPSSRIMTAGDQSALTFEINYSNIGTEEARDLQLQFSGLPLNYFTSISLASRDATAFDCTPITDLGTASCQLQNRLRANEIRMGVLTFSVNRTTIIGNEANFTVMMNITVDVANDNLDSDSTNNMQDIEFSVNSIANIGVTLSSRTELLYSAMVSESITIPGDLGGSYDLTVRVTNSGPSTILNAQVEINFPDQNSQITGSNYFLYPSILSTPMDGDSVKCSEAGLDPNGLVRNGEVFVNGRRKRSLPVSHKARVARKIALRERRTADSENLRQKRQTSDVVYSCLDSPCLRLTCNITGLTTQGVMLLLSTNIDERFFGVGGADRTFILTTSASVSVTEQFQMSGDNLADNSNMATIMLSPTPSDPGNSITIHYIIWPCVIASLIIMVIIVVLLYFLGFFRRKKKPGDGEIEGDFTVPTEVKEIPKEEMTGL